MLFRASPSTMATFAPPAAMKRCPPEQRRDLQSTAGLAGLHPEPYPEKRRRLAVRAAPGLRAERVRREPRARVRTTSP